MVVQKMRQTKRMQINIRSNSYTESLIDAVLEKDTSFDKSKFIHAAIERLAVEILGHEEVMNIRLYEHYK